MKKKFLIIMLEILIMTQFGFNIVEAKTAPGFALYNLDGKLVTLSSLVKENNIIISFWASYCTPCRNEIPQLIDLEKKYAEQKNIKLILVSIEKAGAAETKAALHGMGVNTECLLDPYTVVAKKYIPELRIPALFLVSKKGEILFNNSGYEPESIEKLEKLIIKLQR